jgi:hypothetical protein
MHAFVVRMELCKCACETTRKQAVEVSTHKHTCQISSTNTRGPCFSSQAHARYPVQLQAVDVSLAGKCQISGAPCIFRSVSCLTYTQRAIGSCQCFYFRTQVPDILDYLKRFMFHLASRCQIFSTTASWRCFNSHAHARYQVHLVCSV